jgi:hypothetical protein
LVDMAPVAPFIRPSEGDDRVLEALLARVSEPASKDFAREAVILAACERLREVVPAGASATWRAALQARLAAALCDKLEPVFARAGPPAAEGGPPSAVSVTDAVYADVEEVDGHRDNYLFFDVLRRDDLATDTMCQGVLHALRAYKRGRDTGSAGGGSSGGTNHVIVSTSEESAADLEAVRKGELVRDDLVKRDLGSKKVQSVISQMDAGGRADDEAKQYHFAVYHSLVLLVLVLVSVNVKSSVPGSMAVRGLTAGLYQRMHSMMVDEFNMPVDGVAKAILSIVRFAKDGAGRIWMVDSVHLLLGVRDDGTAVMLIPGSFPELERLFVRVFRLLQLVLPHVFHDKCRAKFLTWMWSFDRTSSLKGLDSATTFANKCYGRMMILYTELMSRFLRDNSRKTPMPFMMPFFGVSGSTIGTEVEDVHVNACRAVHDMYTRAQRGERLAGLPYEGFRPPVKGKVQQLVTASAAGTPGAVVIDVVCIKCKASERQPASAGRTPSGMTAAGAKKWVGAVKGSKIPRKPAAAVIDISEPEPEGAAPAPAGHAAATVALDDMMENIPPTDVAGFSSYVGRTLKWDRHGTPSDRSRPKPCVYDGRFHAFPGIFRECRHGASCNRLHLKGPSERMDEVSARSKESMGGNAGWMPDITAEQLNQLASAFALTKAAVKAAGR